MATSYCHHLILFFDRSLCMHCTSHGIQWSAIYRIELVINAFFLLFDQFSISTLSKAAVIKEKQDKIPAWTAYSIKNSRIVNTNNKKTHIFTNGERIMELLDVYTKSHLDTTFACLYSVQSVHCTHIGHRLLYPQDIENFTEHLFIQFSRAGGC